MKIYLAGGGGLGVEYAEQWRRKATKLLTAGQLVGDRIIRAETIDPFRNGKLRRAYDGGNYQGDKTFGANEIVVRDLRDVARCDLVLAEMRCEDYNYIGTTCEIWEAYRSGKPVVIWTTEKYNLHPWLCVAAVKIFTGELDEACQYILSQWGDV